MEWLSKAPKMGLKEARALANTMGFNFYFDWDTCRTEEGYYKVKGSVELCIARCIVRY